MMPWMIFMFVFIETLFPGCGGGAQRQEGVTEDAIATAYQGSLALTIKEATRSSALSDSTKIQTFRVTIQSDVQKEPLVYTFDGDEESSIINGFPVDSTVDLTVEAINAKNFVTKRGEATAIPITPGVVTDYEMTIYPVPFFVNVFDGNTISQTRFVPQIYSDPGVEVELVDEYQGMETVLEDVHTQLKSLITPEPTGTVKFYPALLPLGTHSFIVRDISTGYGNRVAVRLMKPGTTEGAVFTAGDYLGTGIPTGRESLTLGTTLIDVFERLGNE